MQKAIWVMSVGIFSFVMATCPTISHKEGKEEYAKVVSSSVMSGAADRKLKKDGWELKVWITHQGTRSQGEYAQLIHNGKEVCPKSKSEILYTPLGTMKYMDRPTIFGWHGWYPEKLDPSLQGCDYTHLKGEGKVIDKKDGWVYKVWTTAKGTRSEGKYGRLVHHGKEICPKLGQVVRYTPLGMYIFVDNFQKWGWHGWRLNQK
jgi:hypothetical protein